MLGKNGVLVEEGHGLTDYELVKAFRNCSVMGDYQFREDFIRRTLTVVFASQLELGETGMEFRGDSPPYLRIENKQSRNDFYENSR